MRKLLLFLVTVVAVASLSRAGETKTWRQGDYDDFQKGHLENIAVRSDGQLSLAPVFTEVYDPSSAYLWALVEDSRGNLYVGGGGPGEPGAKLHIISPSGENRVLADLEGLQIQALAIDEADRVYAATSPGGRIYRVTLDGTVEPFYEPGTEYVWAMVFNNDGDLLVATGEPGSIHRVTPDGTGGVFFETGETHARSLALDNEGNLIVGTEPSGLIFRIPPSGEGFVLYQGDKREVTSIAVGGDGTIYAAAVGSKGPATIPVQDLPAPAAPAPQASPRQTSSAGQPGQQAAAGPAASPVRRPSITGGSEVYRIDPDGFPRKIWSHPRDIAYAIAFDAQGRPLIGTGNEGTVYRLDSGILYTALVTAAPTQITSLIAGSNGEIYAATGNIGKVYRLGPGLEKEGYIESDVLDALLFSSWGRLRYRGDSHGGNIAFDSRSGNLERPLKGWSEWSHLELAQEGGRVASPQARFLQWKATLSASSDGHSPTIRSVELAYLRRNVAPEVERIEITQPNYRFPPQTLTLTTSRNIVLQPLGQPSRPSSTPISSSAVSMTYEKGHIGARWQATDGNSDALIHKVEIRGVEETGWKLLEDDVELERLSWDSTAFPDGEYLLRVTASDRLDTPPPQALEGHLESEVFLIDNTPPGISELSATRTEGSLLVQWKATDTLTIIERAEYSLDGGEWTFVEPTTQLSDSQELDYSLTLEAAATEEHTVAVRVTDEYDNQSVEKIVVRE